MAITSIILQTQAGRTEPVRAAVERFDDLQVHGAHEDQYLIVLAEIPAERLERRLEDLERLDGVLALYTTYINTEDEAA